MNEFPAPSDVTNNLQLKNQYCASFEAIRHVQRIIGATDQFEISRDYPDMLLGILKYLPASPATTPLLSFVLDSQSTNESMQRASEVVTAAVTSLPLENTKILEIGGPFGQVLHALGAEVFCVDPDIERVSIFRNVSWKYVPQNRKDFYHPVPVRLTAKNWREFVAPQYFDFAYSRWVLSKSSGTSSDWIREWAESYPVSSQPDTICEYDAYARRREAYNRIATQRDPAEAQARQDLFMIAAAATKKEGLVLHQGDAIEELLTLSGKNELDYLEKRFSGGRTIEPLYWEYPVYVFRKL